MEPLKIALLQIAPCDSLSENLKKGMGACRKAREMGADIALFPEMFSNGYRIYGRPVEEWQAEAIPADGEFVGAFGKLAKELNMAIGITLLERYDGDPRNALVLFDRFGERRLSYSKVHTCDFDVERNLTPPLLQSFFIKHNSSYFLSILNSSVLFKLLIPQKSPLVYILLLLYRYQINSLKIL